jgi:hypothetical protein
MNPLPIQYHLEIYERSFVNDPAIAIQTTTPLPTFAVGDFFSHRTHDGWSQPPDTATEAFRIKEIEHIAWTIENSHVGYKLMLCLEVVSRKG